PSETILVRQIVDDAEIRRIPFAGELPHVRLSGDGRFLFTVSPPNNHLRVWNLTSTPPALEWDTEVGAVAIPRSRREIALSRRNGVMSLYDPVTRREGKRLQLKTAPSAFAVHPSEAKLAVGDGRDVQIWDMEIGKVISVLDQGSGSDRMLWH